MLSLIIAYPLSATIFVGAALLFDNKMVACSMVSLLGIVLYIVSWNIARKYIAYKEIAWYSKPVKAITGWQHIKVLPPFIIAERKWRISISVIPLMVNLENWIFSQVYPALLPFLCLSGFWTQRGLFFVSGQTANTTTFYKHKGGTRYDLWRKKTKAKKGRWSITRGTLLSVRSIKRGKRKIHKSRTYTQMKKEFMSAGKWQTDSLHTKKEKW